VTAFIKGAIFMKFGLAPTTEIIFTTNDLD
jgi:hypothetical protein